MPRKRRAARQFRRKGDMLSDQQALLMLITCPHGYTAAENAQLLDYLANLQSHDQIRAWRKHKAMGCDPATGRCRECGLAGFRHGEFNAAKTQAR